jgi:hypothetical protein
MCHIHGEDPADREFPDNIVNPAMLDVADWLYMPVHSLLGSFCDVISNEQCACPETRSFWYLQPKRGSWQTYRSPTDAGGPNHSNGSSSP